MTDTVAQNDTQPTLNQRVRGSLLRYRVLAWITGIWLLVLTAEVIAKYGFDQDQYGWVGVVHGWVYFVYLLLTLDLAVKVRWKPVHTVLTVLAGTIPFVSFYAEHRNSAQVKRDFGV